MNTQKASSEEEKERGKKPRILDTSAILSREISYIAPDTYVTSSVIGEIQKGAISRNMESVISSISVKDPDPEYLSRAMERAKATGDLRRVSKVDLDVVALGLELNGIVVTDDYSMQNLCLALGVEFTGIEIPVIKKSIVWGFRCTGCGRHYKEKLKECPVCGHRLKNVPRRTAKRD